MAERSRRGVVIAGVMLAIFLAAMESTVVATAMPTVIASLGGIRIYSWVFSAFLLTSTITMPLWGRLSDLLGRRPTYLAGIAIFLLGSGLSGLSQNMAQLIAFRALQGLGAGSLITIGMTLVGDLYGLERRAKMQGYFSGVWGLASLVGPAVGGLLADHVSWRWVFYINLPFGALSALAIGWGLSEPVVHRRSVSIDFLGTAFFTVSISSLLVGLVEGGRAASWLTPGVVVPLAVAAIFLLVFVTVERRVADPLIPLDLFKNPMVRAGAATGFLAGMAMFGAISFIPLYVQAVLGATATQAGFVLTPFILGWVSLSILSARLVLRVGYRGVVVTGMATLTLSFLLLSEWDQTLGRLAAMRDVILAGFGMGMVMVPMLIAVQSAVPKRDLGVATSTIQFFRTIGGAVGISVMGAVMAHRLQAELLAVLAATAPGTRLGSQVQELVSHPDLIVNPATREALAPVLLAHVRLALDHALHGVFVAGLIVCVVALASSFLVPSGRARDLARAEEAASTPPP
ncbi:MAG: MFS transporter [Candidatus Rokubacteria bacterium]|nr:MFS transporter [Candidatus Rokubacteria bacterium]